MDLGELFWPLFKVERATMYIHVCSVSVSTRG